MSGRVRLAPGRSCTACRRRKIRCDRQEPCSYCAKLRLDCVYQASTQDADKPPSDGLASRLRRIELSLQRIESNISKPHKHSSERPLSSTTETLRETTQPSPANVGQQKESARLISEEGDTRYTTGSFWTDLDEAENDEETEALAMKFDAASSSTGHQPSRTFPFSVKPMQASTTHLHPTENRIFAHWQVFIESVDPVLKMIHVPTVQRQLLLACQDFTRIPPAFEGLMFSIYYAVFVSMQSSVSYQTLEMKERETFLKRYQDGIEQSLAKADFICTPSVTTMQALTLYLTCARGFVDKEYIWAMIGLLVRLAMKLGLHRDPSSLKLSPFLSEMRRRLWWQICILDVRVAEDNDTEPLIYEHNHDTRFPANINDSDLDVHMTQSPVETTNRTEMLFTLTRFEISHAARRLVFSQKFSADNGYKQISVQDKDKEIDALSAMIDAKYFHDYDENVPICFLTRTSTRMVLAKMKLTIHHPSRTELPGISQGQLESLIRSSSEIIQYAYGLRGHEKYSRWVWLFQKYVEWDAVAFLLYRMGDAAPSDLFDTAWEAIERFFEYWRGKVPQNDRRWLRLQRMRTKASEKQISPEQHIVGFQKPSSFQDLSSMQGFDRNTRQSHPIHQHELSEDDQLWPTDNDTSWNFDDIPYNLQSVPSWASMFQEPTSRPSS